MEFSAVAAAVVVVVVVVVVVAVVVVATGVGEGVAGVRKAPWFTLVPGEKRRPSASAMPAWAVNPPVVSGQRVKDWSRLQDSSKLTESRTSWFRSKRVTVSPSLLRNSPYSVPTAKTVAWPKVPVGVPPPKTTTAVPGGIRELSGKVKVSRLESLIV